MSAAAALEKKILFNDDGNPTDVVIPYDQFVAFVEKHGLDLSSDEEASLREAN